MVKNDSTWVTHVRKYAKDNNISYMCAISDASKTYKPKAKSPPKTQPKAQPKVQPKAQPTPNDTNMNEVEKAFNKHNRYVTGIRDYMEKYRALTIPNYHMNRIDELKQDYLDAVKKSGKQHNGKLVKLYGYL